MEQASMQELGKEVQKMKRGLETKMENAIQEKLSATLSALTVREAAADQEKLIVGCKKAVMEENKLQIQALEKIRDDLLIEIKNEETLKARELELNEKEQTYDLESVELDLEWDKLKREYNELEDDLELLAEEEQRIKKDREDLEDREKTLEVKRLELMERERQLMGKEEEVKASPSEPTLEEQLRNTGWMSRSDFFSLLAKFNWYTEEGQNFFDLLEHLHRKEKLVDPLIKVDDPSTTITVGVTTDTSIRFLFQGYHANGLKPAMKALHKTMMDKLWQSPHHNDIGEHGFLSGI